MASCSVSRTASKMEEQLSTERVELRDSTEVQSLVVLDTLKEITTITVDRNDKGDTLRLTQITDRTRASARERVKDVEVKVVEKIDTVYIATRDSVQVSNTNLTNPTNRASPFVSALKWVFWIVVAVTVLVAALKIGRKFI